MAKIKTIKTKLGATCYEIEVKCNSSGMFTFDAPAELRSLIEELDMAQSYKYSSLKELEDKVYKIIGEYKKAEIKTRLVVHIRFAARGEITRGEDGYILPQFSDIGGKYNLSLLGGEKDSALKFGYSILIEESINGNISYYNAIKTESTYNSPAYRRIGNYIASNYRYHTSKDDLILPYTDEIINSLKSIERQLKNAAVFLSELLDNDKVEMILSSGNFKLLENKED